MPATNGPATEPSVSRARCSPKLRPARPVPASAATRVSRGASFPPFPNPSRTRSDPTAARPGATAISGRDANETMYAMRVSRRGEAPRSRSRAVARRATVTPTTSDPSTTPSTAAEAPSATTTNVGSSG